MHRVDILYISGSYLPYVSFYYGIRLQDCRSCQMKTLCYLYNTCICNLLSFPLISSIYEGHPISPANGRFLGQGILKWNWKTSPKCHVTCMIFRINMIYQNRSSSHTTDTSKYIFWSQRIYLKEIKKNWNESKNRKSVLTLLFDIVGYFEISVFETSRVESISMWNVCDVVWISVTY